MSKCNTLRRVAIYDKYKGALGGREWAIVTGTCRGLRRKNAKGTGPCLVYGRERAKLTRTYMRPTSA